MYLYQPYLGTFTPWQYLLPVNSVVAAMGAFLLSRRWVCRAAGSLLAGAVFGFGPFVLGLARFHPTAGLLAGSVAWLMLPAARYGRDRPWLAALLCLLPVIAIAAFFRIGACWRLFAVPLTTRLVGGDLAGLIAPLVMVRRTGCLVGLYHVPVAAVVLGLVVTFKARRVGILLLLVAGAALAACRSIYDASPIIWLTLPMLCCAVMSGEGLSVLVLAGKRDQRWILLAVAIQAFLAIVTLLLAAKYFQVLLGLADGYARLFVDTARMFLVGVVAVGIVLAVAAVNRRWLWFRTVVLVGALAIDIFIGARFVVDSIF